MKKIIYFLIIFSIFMTKTLAFTIDIDKININNKLENIQNSIDKSYAIDIEDFDKTIINQENIIPLARNLVKISLNQDNIDDKKKSLTNYLYISKTNGFDTLTGSLAIDLYLDKLKEHNIENTKIKDIKTAETEKDIMVFAYLDDCKTNKGIKDVILAFWLKKDNNDEYKLYYPWLTINDDLENYFNNIQKNEDNGNIIGGTFNKLSLGKEKVTIDETLLNNLYNSNKSSVIQITGMKQNGLNGYGSGFILREGIIVTSWNLFKQFLVNSNYIYINDSLGNTYDIEGIVALQTDYDIVLLKTTKEFGQKVKLGNSLNLKENTPLFMINSKVNSGFSISYGTYLSQNNGRLKNLLLLNESDIGSSLFNEAGEVIGINTQDLLNSDLSYANSTNYLNKIQKILIEKNFNEINFTSLETFKTNFYENIEEEQKDNKIEDRVWDKFKSIGDLENKISLPLIKSYYTDNILSLRYKNNTDNMIDSLYLISDYIEELANSGFQLTYEDKFKKIYINNEYKIIVKDNLNYLIILIIEI